MKKWLPLTVLISSLLSCGAAFLPAPPIPYSSNPHGMFQVKFILRTQHPKKMSWENSLEAAFRINRLIAVSS